MADHFGERLRYLRYTRNWTKLKLSQVAGVPLATISMVERGLRKGDGLSLATVRRLARAFEMSVDELIGPEDEQQAQPTAVALAGV